MEREMIDVGDLVRLVQVPPQVESVSDEKDEMHTKEVFRQCVGNVFRVQGIGTNNPHGETDHIELWVRRGKDCNKFSAKTDSIWVEQDYVTKVIANEG